MTKQRALSPAERQAMDRIADAIQARGWSWSELARRVGKTSSAASQWSGKRAFPTQRTFIAIAAALDVAASWLLSGDDPDAEIKPKTKRQAEALKLMLEMTPEQEAAALAAIQGIAAHMSKK